MTEENKKRKLKWPILIAAIAAVAILVIVLAVSNSPSQRVAKLLDLGQKYLEDGEYEEAIAAFEEVLEIDPKCVEAYLGEAEAYVALDDYESAVAVLEKGYELTGDERLTTMLDGLETAVIRREEETPEVVDMNTEEVGKEEKTESITTPRKDEDPKRDMDENQESSGQLECQKDGDIITITGLSQYDKCCVSIEDYDIATSVMLLPNRLDYRYELWDEWTQCSIFFPAEDTLIFKAESGVKPDTIGIWVEAEDKTKNDPIIREDSWVNASGLYYLGEVFNLSEDSEDFYMEKVASVCDESGNCFIQEEEVWE